MKKATSKNVSCDFCGKEGGGMEFFEQGIYIHLCKTCAISNVKLDFEELKKKNNTHDTTEK